MSHDHFRVVTITLDNEEEVTSVTALASDAETVLLLEETVTGHLAIKTVGPGQIMIDLPLAQMFEVWRASGKVPGTDPQAARWHEMYESLTTVVYGLIQDD